MNLNFFDYDLTKRNGSADLLKGLAVIFMIQVHIMQLFAEESLFNSLTGAFSLFLGGPPAAPVFMTVMGYFLAVSKKDLESSLMRGLYLFLGGILLNIGLNFSLLIKIYNNEFFLDPFQYIFGVDILILAGLSIIILSFLRKIISLHFLIPLLLSFLIAWLTAFSLEFTEPHSHFLRYLIPMIGGNWSWSFFPLLPWLAYPMLGWSFYLMQQEFGYRFKADKQITILVIIAWALYMYITFDFALIVSSNLPVYYHHEIEFFVWTLLFLSGYLFIVSKINSISLAAKPLVYLKWIGKNVTPVYVFQWLIIGNISTFIYKTQSLLFSFLWFFAILLVVTLLVIIWNKIPKNYRPL